jgi:hypothetical protein
MILFLVGDFTEDNEAMVPLALTALGHATGFGWSAHPRLLSPFREVPGTRLSL